MSQHPQWQNKDRGAPARTPDAGIGFTSARRGLASAVTLGSRDSELLGCITSMALWRGEAEELSSGEALQKQ